MLSGYLNLKRPWKSENGNRISTTARDLGPCPSFCPDTYYLDRSSSTTANWIFLWECTRQKIWTDLLPMPTPVVNRARLERNLGAVMFNRKSCHGGTPSWKKCRPHAKSRRTCLPYSYSRSPENTCKETSCLELLMVMAFFQKNKRTMDSERLSRQRHKIHQGFMWS